MIHRLWKAVWPFLIKVNILLRYDFAVSAANVCLYKDLYLNGHQFCSVQGSFIRDSPKMEIAQMFFSR